MKGAVEFDHVSKRYRLGAWGSLRGSLSAWLSRKREAESPRRVLWALRDVSFSLSPGSALGLIGPNGSGKTTTLKLLSRVTYPTAGKITTSGRISSLIELGAGFHPELTGRDNIYLNGAILGFTRREIARRLDAIIAFSELERFIDTPVKRYSSGMYVRLGFAVAAHAEPDILLVDEVLAVGDARFRTRCMRRIRELQHAGTTILFVSHNMHQVREVCDAAMLLMGGDIKAYGEPAAVIAAYEHLTFDKATPAAGSGQREGAEPASMGGVIIRSVEILSLPEGGGQLTSQASALVRIAYSAIGPQPVGRVHIAVYLEDSTLCCVADSTQGAEAGFVLSELSGEGAIEITFDPLQLAMGSYYVVARITDVSDAEVIASRESALFSVLAAQSGDHGGVFVPHVIWNHCGSVEPQGTEVL